MRGSAWMLVAAIVLGARSAAAQGPVEAELIVRGGAVFTADVESPWTDAVAVARGRIIALGTDDEVMALRGSDTRIVDLEGRMVLPALTDVAVPPVRGRSPRENCRIPEHVTPEEQRSLLHGCHERLEEGRWLIGGSWSERAPNEAPEPSMLEAAAPSRAVVFWEASGTRALVSRTALDAVGLDRAPGVVEGDELGAVLAGLPPGEAARRSAVIREALDEYVRAGITTVQFGPVGASDLEALSRLDGVQEHPLRLVGQLDRGLLGYALASGAFTSSTSTTAIAARERWGAIEREAPLAATATVRAALTDRVRRIEREVRKLSPDQRERLRHVQIALDGPLLERQAYLRSAYSGTRRRGPRPLSPDRIADLVEELQALGLSVELVTHGDGAVHRAIRALERLAERTSTVDRVRLSEVTLIYPADLERLATLDVVAQLGPCADLFARREAVERLIGERRFARVCPSRELEELGVRVAVSPRMPARPAFREVEALVTRSNPDLPETAPVDELGSSLESVLRMLTVGSARAVGLDHGRLAVGERADFVVLDRHLGRGPAPLISDAIVDYTVVDGAIVYGREVAVESRVERESHPQDSPDNTGFTFFIEPIDASLRVRGSVRLNLALDFNGLNGSFQFNPTQILVGDANRFDPALTGGPFQTRLGLEIEKETIFTRIEADFFPEGQLRLRHAYMTIRVDRSQVTVGQFWTAFLDVSSLPLTVDFEGASGGPETERQAQVRWTLQASSNLRLTTSLELPRLDVEVSDPDLELPQQVLPDVVFRFQSRRWSGVSAAALVRLLDLRTSLDDDFDVEPGVGLDIAGTLRVTERDSIRFNVAGGYGIGRYIRSTALENRDAVYNPDTGTLAPYWTVSGYVAETHRWNSLLQSSAVISATRVFNLDFESDDVLAWGGSLLLNTFWDPLRGIRIGVEYGLGLRVNKGGAVGMANRIGGIAMYDF